MSKKTIEGRLRFQRISGPVSPDPPVLQIGDDEFVSVDVWLQQYSGRYIEITVKDYEDANSERLQDKTTDPFYSSHRRRGNAEDPI